MAFFQRDIKIINNKTMEILKDEQGIEWYPLKTFLELQLFLRNPVLTPYINSNLRRFMQVINYQPSFYPEKPATDTWFISYGGIRCLLRTIKLPRTTDKELGKIRRERLKEACLYFKVMPLDKEIATVTYITPNLDTYDIWSQVCIRNDFSVGRNTQWKRCKICGYYYPNSPTYFWQGKSHCKQCCGYNFKCPNKVIQFFYDNGGYDLICALETENKDKIIEKLQDFIERGGVIDIDLKKRLGIKS